MANVKKEQEDTMASIDAAKVLIEKVVTIMEIATVNPSITLTFSANPIGFIMQILKHLGISREEIEKFLTNFLIYTIPSLELGVKAILLTNLKNMVSCSIDPRIPEKYRKKHKSLVDYNTSQEYGIDINIESIDFMDKLSINPLGDYGSQWYFGLEGVENSYKLAKAEDMDAFLWFVIHKGKFPNSTKLSSDLTEFNDENRKFIPENGTLLSTLSILQEANKEVTPSKILLGNTFAYSRSTNIISMAIDNEYDKDNNIIENVITPVSDDWSSVNWYTRREEYLGKNIGLGYGISRKTGNTYYKGKASFKHSEVKKKKYSDERPICNIQYIDQASSESPITGLVNNKFRLTVLPKPYIHKPSTVEAPWEFKKMLFNDKCEYDPNGKYTFINGVTESFNNNIVTFTINGIKLCTLDIYSRKVTTETATTVAPYLMECYPGLTLYEFNYDYVMGMKLFDPKVLLHSIMDSLINTNVGITYGINRRHQDASERIKQIIKQIIETDESEVNDCYYSFDNSKYEALLRKSDEKRANQQRFGNVTKEIGTFDDVNEILSEYDDEAELHERIDVLHRAINTAASVLSNGVDEENKYDVEFNFVTDLIEALTTAIVNGILSPKVLMLLEVNQKMMGGTWEKFSMEDLLIALKSIILSSIKEIKDMIIQELLKLVINTLEPIIQTLSSILVREQLENYADAIKEIIRNCPSLSFGLNYKYDDTKIYNVDYADIDTSITNGNEMPSTNKC